MNFIPSLAAFVDAVRKDAELEGYYGQFLNFEWSKITFIDGEDGVWIVGNTKNIPAISFLGFHFTLDELRERMPR
jgi:hypothetical protein